MFKALVIVCILLGYVYDFATTWLDDSWEKKHALPESVRDALKHGIEEGVPEPFDIRSDRHAEANADHL